MLFAHTPAVFSAIERRCFKAPCHVLILSNSHNVAAVSIKERNTSAKLTLIIQINTHARAQHALIRP
jgi:hypothetical protein